MDIRRPVDESPYARFVQGSVTDSEAMGALFREARPDCAVHLAFVVNAMHDEKREAEIDTKGAANFLHNLSVGGTPKAVFMSSVAAYGAYAGSPQPYVEDSPLNGNPAYSYSRLKAATDLMAQEFMSGHPECAFVLLRPCLFVGPNTDNSFFEVLKFPVVPKMKDETGVRDIDFQFIHEVDMADCLVAAIEKKVHGIYNVAGDGTVKFSEIAHMAQKACITLPSWLLYPMTALLWRLRLVGSPPGQLDFMRYPWILDNSRMKSALFVPRYSSIEAFKAFAASKKCRSVGV